MMKEYSTAINPLGSIPDINVIFETIKYYKELDDISEVREEFVNGNDFGFDISSSRKRFFSVIKKLFLNDSNEANDFFLDSITSEKISDSFKRALLYLEVCRSDNLFFDITTNLVHKKYVENRRLITSAEVYDFLVDFGERTKIEEWSKSTVKIIGSKYIGFMKRLGYFEAQTRQKSLFSFPYPTVAIITYLIYLLKLSGSSDNEVYQSELFTALILSQSEKLDLLKQGSLAGYYDFSISGNGNVDIVLKFNEEEIIDELFA